MPEQKTLVEQHLELLQLNDIPPAFLPLWNYVRFRLEVKTEGYQTAYFLILKYPDLLQQLTALECFELGNLILNDGDDNELTLENKIRCLTQACVFFYKAYQKNQDDKQIYALLLRLLSEKDAWEVGQKPAYAYQGETSEGELLLIRRLSEKVICQTSYSDELELIMQYRETHLEALSPCEYQLLTCLGRRLSYNIPLTDSLRQSHIKQEVTNLLINNPLLNSLLANETGKNVVQVSPPTTQSPFATHPARFGYASTVPPQTDADQAKSQRFNL